MPDLTNAADRLRAAAALIRERADSCIIAAGPDWWEGTEDRLTGAIGVIDAELIAAMTPSIVLLVADVLKQEADTRSAMVGEMLSVGWNETDAAESAWTDNACLKLADALLGGDA